MKEENKRITDIFLNKDYVEEQLRQPLTNFTKEELKDFMIKYVEEIRNIGKLDTYKFKVLKYDLAMRNITWKEYYKK